MSCVEFPHVGIPDIPGLDLFLGDIAITPPSLSLDFCCKVQFPANPIPLVIPLGAIFAAARASIGTSTTLDTVLTTVSLVVKTVNDLLDQLTFDCPLD